MICDDRAYQLGTLKPPAIRSVFHLPIILSVHVFRLELLKVHSTIHLNDLGPTHAHFIHGLTCVKYLLLLGSLLGLVKVSYQPCLW